MSAISQSRSPDAEGTLQRKRRHLLWRIHRRYQTVTEQLNINPLELQFTRIADPDVVLDEVAEEEDRLDRLHGRRRTDELHLPYWAQLWDSGLGVGQWLVSNDYLAMPASATGHPERSEGSRGSGNARHLEVPRPVAALRVTGAGKTSHAVRVTTSAKSQAATRVLDLGCGMGLAGTVAARLGCDVTFADIEPAGLLFAAVNSLPDADHVRTRRLNWQTDQLPERFDLILGADILYERAQWPHLERFWGEHLSDGGRIILGEPGRQTGEGFLEWLGRFPWDVEKSEQPVPTRERPIRLFILSRRL